MIFSNEPNKVNISSLLCEVNNTDLPLAKQRCAQKTSSWLTSECYVDLPEHWQQPTPAGWCLLSHHKSNLGLVWAVQQRPRGTDLASRHPGSQSNTSISWKHQNKLEAKSSPASQLDPVPMHAICFYTTPSTTVYCLTLQECFRGYYPHSSP